VVDAGQLEDVNHLLRHLQTNDQPIPDELPIVVQEYLRATDQPPAWIDFDRIAGCHTFFLDDGLQISFVLSTAAMVQCYAAHRAVKTLAFTRNLDYPQRRVAETAQFCLYMMGEGGFAPGGRFIPAVQKVRLIHAAVRHLIHRSGRWDRAAWGEPICQEDLLGALLIFTTEVLRGLERLGVPATPEEAEDYYYVWRVVGVMLGIREDIIPPTLAEAAALNTILRARHFGPSPEGVRLTASLLQMYDHLVPGELLDGTIPALIRYIIGEEVADWMDVPRSGWEAIVQFAPFIGQLWEAAEDHNALVRQILDKAAWAFMQGQFLVLNGRRSAVYAIPADLRCAWGLDPAPNTGDP